MEHFIMNVQRIATFIPCLCLVFGLLGQEKARTPVISSSKDWGANMGLQKPESVVYDFNNQSFYVSNGAQFAPGTEGFISKFDAQGVLTQLKWVDSLSRPTGMAIFKNKLWVADVNQLKVIDIANGLLLKSYSEPIENSGINDVAISKEGEVYVSASFVHAVLKVENDSLKLWAQDEEKLQWANGIFIEDEQVLVGGTELAAIDRNSGTIKILKTNPPIQDIDGLWPDGQGGYLLSTVEGNSLWHLTASGETTLLNNGGGYFGDLQFIADTRTLLIPRGNHDEGRYYISAFALDLPR